MKPAKPFPAVSICSVNPYMKHVLNNYQDFQKLVSNKIKEICKKIKKD